MEVFQTASKDFGSDPEAVFHAGFTMTLLEREQKAFLFPFSRCGDRGTEKADAEQVTVAEPGTGSLQLPTRDTAAWREDIKQTSSFLQRAVRACTFFLIATHKRQVLVGESWRSPSESREAEGTQCVLERSHNF